MTEPNHAPGNEVLETALLPGSPLRMGLLKVLADVPGGMGLIPLHAMLENRLGRTVPQHVFKAVLGALRLPVADGRQPLVAHERTGNFIRVYSPQSREAALARKQWGKAHQAQAMQAELMQRMQAGHPRPRAC